MTELVCLAGDLGYIESPRWRNGRLWFTSWADNSICSVSPTGKLRHEIRLDELPSGFTVSGNDLAVGLAASRTILQLGPAGLPRYVDLSQATAFALNDLTTHDGFIYCGAIGFDVEGWVAANGIQAAFGDPGAPRGQIFVADKQGRLIQTVEGLRLPNGLVVTQDGRTLIAAETLGMCLTSFQIDAEGRLGAPIPWATLPGIAPDGICLDAESCVWVADAGSGRCMRVAEGGAVRDLVLVEGVAIACALGGDDGRDLFVLTAGSANSSETNALRTGRICVARVPVPATDPP